MSALRDEMQKAQFVIQAERESKLVDALYRARHALAIHAGMTVRSEGEEWPLDFTQELKMVDAALQMAGVDTKRMDSPARCVSKQ